MKKLFALLLALVVSVAGADTTTNVLSNTPWTGVTNGSLPGNRMPGSSLLYDNATGTVNWSYSTATAAKTIAINNALSGTGVQVGGYNYTYDLRNMNGDNRQGSVDTMTVTTRMTSNTGATLLTNTNTHNTLFDWTTFNGTQTLNSALPLSGLGNLSISFTSRDVGYWNGWFGPEVRNVGMSLNYTVVDPCIANPAANSGCPGYTTNILTSNNLLPGTTGVQSYAINQALALSGSGVMIHGFNYGYNYNIGGQQCTATNQDGSCSWWMASAASVVTTIKDNNAGTIYSQTDSYTGPTSGAKATTYLFPASRNLATLSTFRMSPGISGSGSITGMYSRAIYTPDWCAQNPTYDPSCPGYNNVMTSDNLFSGTTGARAYAINTALAAAGAGAKIHGFDYGYAYNVAGRDCSAWNLLGVCFGGYNYSDASVTTTLTSSAGIVGYTQTNTHAGGNNGVSGTYSKSLRLNSSVPMSTLGTFSMTPTTNGNASITDMYSRAVYTPDPCTADPLSSTSCAGYAQAYHDQQCSINPLFAVDCTGYQAAYLTQQCTSNPLYNSSCVGYATAYFNQQCSVSALYDSTCPGYQQAYLTQQCNISPLYSNQCTGYAVAYHDQQCGISALYMSDCPGYQQAYFSQQCTSNPLYSNQCPGYTVAYKNQQCSINPLYATDCTGYAAAYHTQQCSANPLYMTDCPGYQAAYLTQQCNISQLYSTSCPSYQQAYFNQQCQLNGLYDRSCPNYSTAYASKQLLDAPKATTTTSTVVISTESNATVTSNPAAIAISDPVVSSAVSTPSTTSATSPTSVTSVISAPAAATSPAAVAATTPAPAPAPSVETKQEAKKTETAVARAAARGNAAAAAKEAATATANATSMEAQVASQGLVVGLMGYVPGFNAYQNAIVPDTLANAVARQYHKPTVDNRNAQRRLTGASDARWQEMVDSQYRLGDK